MPGGECGGGVPEERGGVGVCGDAGAGAGRCPHVGRGWPWGWAEVTEERGGVSGAFWAGWWRGLWAKARLPWGRQVHPGSEPEHLASWCTGGTTSPNCRASKTRQRSLRAGGLWGVRGSRSQGSGPAGSLCEWRRGDGPGQGVGSGAPWPALTAAVAG